MAGCQSSSSGAGITYPLELADVLPVEFVGEASESSESSDFPTGVAIKLAIATSRWKANQLDGVRVRVQAVDALDMPTKIFAYLTLPMDPTTGTRTATFDHVCSAADLQDFPEDTPIPGMSPEWLRLNYVDVVLRSWEDVTDLISKIKEDVQGLRDTLAEMDTLTTQEHVWITEP
jgi:hypothetical protein